MSSKGEAVNENNK